jgi:Ricin-type beta-trefoil lectin domain-like
MPGQRRTAGPHARESWLPRLAGIGVVVLLAGGGVTGYLLAVHPSAPHHAAPLPTRVLSYQTVGLIAQVAEPGSTAGQLVQLLSSTGPPQFTPLEPVQAAEGSPQWTADEMAGGTYIFIYLKTGRCLSATGSRGRARLALQHCDLGAQQRWRRTAAPVLTQRHDFYQYANVADGSCLTQTGLLPGQVYGANLAACVASDPPSQLIAFWWSSV